MNAKKDNSSNIIVVILLGLFVTTLVLIGNSENNIPDNFTLETSEAGERVYYSNVLPSKQCAGVSITNMLKARNQYSTGSMRPYIYKDDVLLMIEYDPEKELVLGDVVDNTETLHRVVAINEVDQRYQTKGDNNERKDSGWTNFNETKRVVCGVLRGTR